MSNAKPRALINGCNYFSIWKKDKSKHFKLLFDGGVNHTSINEDYQQKVINSATQVMVFKKSKRTKPSAPPILVTSDEAIKYLDEEVLILRADQQIRLGKSYYPSNPDVFTYHQKQNGYDESGQLYYVVGHLYANNSTIKPNKIKGFYAQVWHFEKKWTIVADVVQLAD